MLKVAVITHRACGTVESLLTTAVKRFVGPICDLAQTRAPRPVREDNPRLRHSKYLSLMREPPTPLQFVALG